MEVICLAKTRTEFAVPINLVLKKIKYKLNLVYLKVLINSDLAQQKVRNLILFNIIFQYKLPVKDSISLMKNLILLKPLKLNNVI